MGGNPVAAALAATVVRYRLPPQMFLDLLEARAFDLYDDPMGSFDELDAYAEKTTSVVMALAAQILNDGRDPGTKDLIRHAGIAHGIAGLLTSFPLHAARRQLYLPLDVMQRLGARAEDMHSQGLRHRSCSSTRGVAPARARASFASKRGRRCACRPSSRRRCCLRRLYGPTLDRLERRSKSPFAATPLPQWRRQWRLWRAARNPRNACSRQKARVVMALARGRDDADRPRVQGEDSAAIRARSSSARRVSARFLAMVLAVPRRRLPSASIVGTRASGGNRPKLTFIGW